MGVDGAGHDGHATTFNYPVRRSVGAGETGSIQRKLMIRRNAWWVGLIVVAVSLCLFQGVSFGQCPMCKTGLTSSSEGTKLVTGFRNGILLLLIIPSVLFGTMAFLIFHVYRERELDKRPDQPGAPRAMGKGV